MIDDAGACAVLTTSHKRICPLADELEKSNTAITSADNEIEDFPLNGWKVKLRMKTILCSEINKHGFQQVWGLELVSRKMIGVFFLRMGEQVQICKIIFRVASITPKDI